MNCWYCENEKKTGVAAFVAHDVRGCLLVCESHGNWRATTSMGMGHKGCPDGHPDGPQRDGKFVHITPLRRFA